MDGPSVLFPFPLFSSDGTAVTAYLKLEGLLSLMMTWQDRWVEEVEEVLFGWLEEEGATAMKR